MFQRKFINTATKNALDYGLLRSNTWNGFSSKINIKRCFSNAELSSVLRPFYFAVHPDLFGRHPEQRSTNEESLKHLSAYLESLQKQRTLTSSPKYINFYIRDSRSRDKFRMVRIPLERQLDLKRFIKNILESCNLPTEHVDKLKASAKSTSSRFTAEANVYRQAASIFEQYELHIRNINKAKQEKTLKKWLDNNIKVANERWQSREIIRNEVEKLEKKITANLNLTGIKYDCGWNVEHTRGLLKSLDHLSKMHANDLKELIGRTVVFAQASGVNLEGHIMLSTGDVQHHWLDFIKNIPKQDEYLKRIPSYEQALSQVLCGIQIARRKFMPKAQVVHYAAYLCKVTTSMLDYLTIHSTYPKSWPTDLSNFEIVIESEAGPLCVSPTGQFIAPSTCPGSILVDFLSNHMDEAAEKSEQYKRNKHIERELYQKCKNSLNISRLTKDDSVDPSKMIECLERLLKSNAQMNNCELHITHYYSVLSDGTVCIPWDWVFE